RTHYAEGFTTPTLDQLFRNNSDYIPNPGLSPEKSKTYEVGADLAWNFVDASLTYFHTKYEDKIIGVETNRPKPVGAGNLWQYQNLDGAVLAGFEFSFGVDLGAAFEQDFSLRPYAGFTYLTDRKNKDKRNVVSIDPGVLASTPEWTAAFGLTFEHPDINLSTTLNGNYMGPMYTQDWSGAHSIDRGDMTPGNWVEQSGFTVWNWSLDKRLWDFEDKGNLGLRVEVNNLFDKEYAYVLDYPMPGRNFYVGVNYSY
ncbi:TonB-dependent receptor, partial [Deltaproteobacteria bacterium OttesenSCG-928-M10]|nr:TonB-dependent receptor [Deltaproteobacteria bacterium OttesenSCG-928-M10]